jgi:hypothetical protein
MVLIRTSSLSNFKREKLFQKSLCCSSAGWICPQPACHYDLAARSLWGHASSPGWHAPSPSPSGWHASSPGWHATSPSSLRPSPFHSSPCRCPSVSLSLWNGERTSSACPGPCPASSPHHCTVLPCWSLPPAGLKEHAARMMEFAIGYNWNLFIVYLLWPG